METRALAGREVSCIGLGGMPLSIAGRPPEDRGVAVIHAALDRGITLIDTADVYCLDDGDIGHNERLIARALAARPDGGAGVLVATKGGLARPRGAWTNSAHPDHLKRACERSLKALGVEAIQLYQLHAPDPAVPWEDSVGALAELKAAGKIVHVGLSNVDVDEIERARAIVEIASVQNRCNVLDRSSFSGGVVAHCERHGIAFLPYSPVGGHGLDGRRQIATHPVLVRVAERHGATPPQVAIAWLLHRSPVMIPIPGASRVESVVSSVAAARLRLDPEDIAAIDDIQPGV